MAGIKVWAVGDPVDASDLNGNFSQIIASQSYTAGETIAINDSLYFNASDSKVYKAGANTASNVENWIGFAKEAGVANDVIKVQTVGQCSGFVGLTPGSIYYMGATTGTIATTVTFRQVGVAISATALLIYPRTKNEIPAGTIMPYAGSSSPTNFLLCDGASYLRTDYSLLFAVIGTTFGSVDGTHFNVPDLRCRIPVGVGSSVTKVATFASRASNVITVTGLTNAANNEFQTGQAVTYHTSGTVITGLTNDTVYYIVRTGNLTFSLATSVANANAGIVIALSSDGSGTQTFTLSLTNRALADTGGEENHALTDSEMPSHYHTVTGSGGSTAGLYTSSSNVAPTSQNTDEKGNDAVHNNMSPFLALNYIIKI